MPIDCVTGTSMGCDRWGRVRQRHDPRRDGPDDRTPRGRRVRFAADSLARSRPPQRFAAYQTHRTTSQVADLRPVDEIRFAPMRRITFPERGFGPTSRSSRQSRRWAPKATTIGGMRICSTPTRSVGTRSMPAFAVRVRCRAAGTELHVGAVGRLPPAIGVFHGAALNERFAFRSPRLCLQAARHSAGTVCRNVRGDRRIREAAAGRQSFGRVVPRLRVRGARQSDRPGVPGLRRRFARQSQRVFFPEAAVTVWTRRSSASGQCRIARTKKKGVAFAYDPAVHVVGDTGFEPVTPAV